MPPDAVPPDPPAEHPLVACFNAARGELLGTLRFVLGSRDDALDVAQEAFLKCWRARETMAGVTNLRAWVFKVALNAAKDHRKSAWSRRVKPLTPEAGMATAPGRPPDAAAEDAEAVAALRAAIAGLRPDEQAVLLLRQNGGLTYEEIAALRGAPVGTVKTQMRTALIKLRRALGPADDPPSAPAGDGHGLL